MALFDGYVMHCRLRPFRHKFRYHVFSLALDIDRLAEMSSGSRLFSYNRPNLISFSDEDHGPRDGSPLRPWVEKQLHAAGITEIPARIELICFPRIFGYVFNPLSLFFCRDGEERVFAVIYEVKNTFGEQHTYVNAVDRGLSLHQHRNGKSFYVSPFYDVSGDYGFRISLSEEKYALRILHSDEDGPHMVANHVARRKPASDRALLGMLFKIPLMPVKVMAGIHFEAVKLWLKGAKYRPHTGPVRQSGGSEALTLQRSGQ